MDLTKKHTTRKHQSSAESDGEDANVTIDEIIQGCTEKSPLIKLIKTVYSSITCSICQEIMLMPFMLQCGHTYCYNCVKEWTANQRKCPECRTNIKRLPILNLKLREVVDSFLESVVKIRPDFKKILKNLEKRLTADYRIDSKNDYLFNGIFHDLMEVVIDRADGVARCSRCHWEAHGTQCLNCGAVFSDPLDDDEDEEMDSDEDGENIHYYGFNFGDRTIRSDDDDDDDDEEGEEDDDDEASDDSSFIDHRDLNEINNDLDELDEAYHRLHGVSDEYERHSSGSEDANFAASSGHFVNSGGFPVYVEGDNNHSNNDDSSDNDGQVHSATTGAEVINVDEHSSSDYGDADDDESVTITKRRPTTRILSSEEEDDDDDEESEDSRVTVTRRKNQIPNPARSQQQRQSHSRSNTGTRRIGIHDDDDDDEDD